MNWKPKNETIGVPGLGYILASDFKQEHLDSLIERAERRGLHKETFLLGCGLVPEMPQHEIFSEPKVAVEEVIEEKPKRGRKPKTEIEQ